MYLRPVRTFLLVASVISLTPDAGGAADAAPASQCAEIASDTDRLACYDRLFAPRRAEQVESPSTVRAAAAPTATETHRNFGLSESARQQKAGMPTAADSISVTIKSIGRRATGEQVFQTADDQTWVEVEPTSRVRVEPGETVTIRKAALGSYLLVTSGRVGTKVRRVK